MKILSSLFKNLKEKEEKEETLSSEAFDLIKNLEQRNVCGNMNYYIVTYALNLDNYLHTIAEITFYNFFQNRKYDFKNVEHLKEIKKNAYEYIHKISSVLNNKEEKLKEEKLGFTEERLLNLLSFLLCLKLIDNDVEKLKALQKKYNLVKEKNNEKTKKEEETKDKSND